MDLGRIVCILFATKTGKVLYERFYAKFSEAEKAEVRAGLDAASAPVIDSLPDEKPRVAKYKYVCVCAPGWRVGPPAS